MQILLLKNTLLDRSCAKPRYLTARYHAKLAAHHADATDN